MFSRVRAWAKTAAMASALSAFFACAGSPPNVAEPRPDLADSRGAAPVGASSQLSAEPPSEPKPPPSLGVSIARPWLGIEMRLEPQGVVVERVFRGSAADAAGLQPGDVLVRLGDVGITQPTDVHAALARRSVGERVAAAVRRHGESRLFGVVLSPKPSTDGLLRQLFLDAPASSLSSLTVVSGSVTPSLGELRGRVVVLEFWASFCGACRAMTPTLNAWHDALSAEGVRVLGITTDPFEEAERAAQQLEIRYPVFVDDGAVSAAYHALALPTLFVIDKQGLVRDVMVGFDSRRLSELETLIRRLAAEPRALGTVVDEASGT